MAFRRDRCGRYPSVAGHPVRLRHDCTRSARHGCAPAAVFLDRGGMAEAGGRFAVRGAAGICAVQCGDAGPGRDDRKVRRHSRRTGGVADRRLLWLRLHRRHRAGICDGADAERRRCCDADYRAIPLTVLADRRGGARCRDILELPGGIRGKCRAVLADARPAAPGEGAAGPRRLRRLVACRPLVLPGPAAKPRRAVCIVPADLRHRTTRANMRPPTCSAACRSMSTASPGQPSPLQWSFCSLPSPH